MNTPSRNCPICDSTEKKIIFRQSFSMLTIGSALDGYDVVICLDCGFAYADHIPDQATFDAYYHNLTKYAYYDAGLEPLSFKNSQFPILGKFIGEHIPDKQTRILEVGCASAGLLNELKQNGYTNVMGADPFPAWHAHAREKYGIDVLTSTLADLDPEKIGRFDLIMMEAVMEHISDLDGAVTKLYDLLTQDGKLFVEVPDATRFEFSSSVYGPFEEFSIEHVNFFGPVSLTNLLKVYGFVPVYWERSQYGAFDKRRDCVTRLIVEKGNDEIVYDAETEPALLKYIAACDIIQKVVLEAIDRLANENIPIIVWGVGTHTQRLLTMSRLKDIEIVAFADSNTSYQGDNIHGVEIFAPEKVTGTEPILVSSRMYQDTIIRQIRSVGLTNRIITLYED